MGYFCEAFIQARKYPPTHETQSPYPYTFLTTQVFFLNPFCVPLLLRLLLAVCSLLLYPYSTISCTLLRSLYHIYVRMWFRPPSLSFVGLHPPCCTPIWACLRLPPPTPFVASPYLGMLTFSLIVPIRILSNRFTSSPTFWTSLNLAKPKMVCPLISYHPHTLYRTKIFHMCSFILPRSVQRCQCSLMFPTLSFSLPLLLVGSWPLSGAYA